MEADDCILTMTVRFLWGLVMPFLSLSSTLPNAQAAVDEIVSRCAAEWSGDVDLAIAFYSRSPAPILSKLPVPRD